MTRSTSPLCSCHGEPMRPRSDREGWRCGVKIRERERRNRERKREALAGAPPSLQERFWSKTVRTEAGCLEWQGHRLKSGYGRFGVREGYIEMAYRVAYELTFGPIPPGYHVHHRCHNRACVEPSHLVAVSPLTHVHLEPASHATKTHCPQGHPYDEENTYWHSKNNRRHCRICRAAADERYQARKRARRMATQGTLVSSS